MDAQAYLLERLGEISAALEIYVRELEASTQALIDAVLGGKIPPAKLAAVVKPKCSHSRLLGRERALHNHADLPPEVSSYRSQCTSSYIQRDAFQLLST